MEVHIAGLVQERRNSIANALELRLSCTNPYIFELDQNDSTQEGFHCVILNLILSQHYSSVDTYFSKLGNQTLHPRLMQSLPATSNRQQRSRFPTMFLSTYRNVIYITLCLWYIITHCIRRTIFLWYTIFWLFLRYPWIDHPIDIINSLKLSNTCIRH